MPMGLAIAGDDGPIPQKTAERGENAKCHALNGWRRLSEANHVGKLSCDDGTLEEIGSAFLVHEAIVGETEQHADQHLEAIGIDVPRPAGAIDLDQDVGLVGLAAVPPVMGDPWWHRSRIGQVRATGSRRRCEHRAYRSER